MGTTAPAKNETEDLPRAAPGPTGTMVAKAVGNGKQAADAEFAADEVMGDAVATRPDEESGQDDDFSEVANGQGSESTFLVATESQLGAESAGDDATSDLAGIDGFEPPKSAQESEADAPLLEAGEAAGLASRWTRSRSSGSLAVLAPTLVSTIGPSVAKAVMGRLSP